MKDINLLEELEKVQIETNQNHVLRAAENILRQDSALETEIEKRIVSNNVTGSTNLVEQFDQNRVFDIDSIRKLCTTYRLRFLESNLFKGDIPAEAIREVKHLEQKSGTRLSQFKVIAPEERFSLVDSSKDPILMAQLPNGQYYFIHQWGNDMKWYQHILKYPFRHIGTLATSSSLIGFIITFLLPSQFDSSKAEFFYRFFMFSMSTCLLMTLAIIVGIMYSKDFSENVWNSKFIK